MSEMPAKCDFAAWGKTHVAKQIAQYCIWWAISYCVDSSYFHESQASTFVFSYWGSRILFSKTDVLHTNKNGSSDIVSIHELRYAERTYVHTGSSCASDCRLYCFIYWLSYCLFCLYGWPPPHKAILKDAFKWGGRKHRTGHMRPMRANRLIQPGMFVPFRHALT